MSDKILLRRGLEAELPILEEGELGFCTDSMKLFVGSSMGNILINGIQTNPPDPTEPESYPTTLIATQGSNFVDLNKSNNTIKLSTNHGFSYQHTISISGIPVIKYIHIFNDGSIMIASHNKVYYSTNLTSFTESTVLNASGAPATMSTYDNFSTYVYDPRPQIVNGVEMLVWGNYSTESGTHYSNVNLWYTTNKGQTIKTAYKFNTGSNVYTRHVHGVVINPNDNSFWVMTGDNSTPQEESHVMRGVYNTTTDTWTWTTIGSGQTFKWASLAFIGDYAYWSHDVSNGGVVRSLISEISNASKHEKLMTTTNDTINIVASKWGELIVTQSFWGGSDRTDKLWYSANRKNFTEINAPYFNGAGNRTTVYDVLQMTSLGKVSAGVHDGNTVSLRDWDLQPRVFLDDIIRNAGFPNAFMPPSSGVVSAGEVTGVTSSTSEGQVTLNWTNPTTGHLSHVRILRNGTLLRNHISGNSFTDITSVNGTTYTYTIQTVDIENKISTGVVRTIQVGGSTPPASTLETNGLLYYWNAKAGMTNNTLANLAPAGATANATVAGGSLDTTNGWISLPTINDKLTFPTVSQFSQKGSFSFEFIYQFPTEITPETYYELLSGTSFMDGYLDMGTTGGTREFYMYRYTGTTFTGSIGFAVAAPELVPNTKIHIVRTFDSATMQHRVYVNNRLALSETIGATISFMFNGEGLQIHRIAEDSVPTQINFHAFRFYDRALTQAEVANNFNNGIEVGLG